MGTSEDIFLSFFLPTACGHILTWFSIATLLLLTLDGARQSVVRANTSELGLFST